MQAMTRRHRPSRQTFDFYPHRHRRSGNNRRTRAIRSARLRAADGIGNRQVAASCHHRGVRGGCSVVELYIARGCALATGLRVDGESLPRTLARRHAIETRRRRKDGHRHQGRDCCRSGAREGVGQSGSEVGSLERAAAHAKRAVPPHIRLDRRQQRSIVASIACAEAASAVFCPFAVRAKRSILRRNE